MDDATSNVARKMREDFAGACERLFKIKTKDGDIVPLTLNDQQRIILSVMEKMDDEGRPIRVIILKARQGGVSTFSQAWLAHKAITRPGHSCLTIAQKEDPAAELFGKSEMIFKLLPDPLRGALDAARDGRRTGKKLAFGDPLHTLLYVETAENRDAGRSQTFQHAHCTELPYWPDAKRTMDGLLQSIPKKRGTSVIIESTAQGMGDYFHEMWLKAERDEIDFVPIFLPWFIFSDYTRDVSPLDRPLTSEERRIKAEFNLTVEQLMWRRDKIAELGEDKFRQEFPATAKEAFLVSGRPFFHIKSIEAIRRNIYEDERDERGWLLLREPPRRGSFVVPQGRRRAKFLDDPAGDLWIWEPPVANARYVLGADVASGRARDYSACQVLRVTHDGLEQVASYRGKCDPDELAVLIWRLCKLYNNALAVPERNGPGMWCLTKLLTGLHYMNVYRHRDVDRRKPNDSELYGFHTNPATRPPMLEHLNQVVRDEWVTIRDPRTLEDMETFVIADELGKKAEANQGAYDDMVMALGLAVAGSSRVSPVSADAGVVVDAPRQRRVSKTTGY